MNYVCYVYAITFLFHYINEIYATLTLLVYSAGSLVVDFEVELDASSDKSEVVSGLVDLASASSLEIANQTVKVLSLTVDSQECKSKILKLFHFPVELIYFI